MEYAWVISAGTELTLGQTPDTNAAWLAARLAALGIRPVRHVVVPDDLAAMCAVLREAAAACDVILMSGGLGPTADDLTRQAVAEVAGVPLELHAPSLEHLRAFFAARGRELPASNTVQALVPRGATALPNACGTAPGLHVALAPRGIPCFCLPGVPFEMRAMFEAEVAPRLSVAQRGAVILTRRLHTFGL
ncbi:MAG: competence/damage-inducible protein A, partial [Planctomycetota bacterium]